MVNTFFKNHGPFKIKELIETLGLKNFKIDNNLEVLDIKDLFNSENGDITFFHSNKYRDVALKTKASFCIITENLKDNLNKNCTPIVVRNVLLSTSTITSKFYPESLHDNFDELPKPVQEVFIEACFVIGTTGFSKFKKTLELINNKQYTEASEEIKNSLWYRQVPQRVEMLSQKLQNV